MDGKESYDLLVVGARGAGFVSRLLLGSTSDTVVSQSKSSVLVVRPAKHPDNVDHSPHITLAWDGSDSARAALDLSQGWKLVPDSRVSILEVLPRPRDLPEDIVYDPKRVHDQKSQLDAICTEFRRHYHNVDAPRRRIHLGRIYDRRICRSAQQLPHCHWG